MILTNNLMPNRIGRPGVVISIDHDYRPQTAINALDHRRVESGISTVVKKARLPASAHHEHTKPIIVLLRGEHQTSG